MTKELQESLEAMVLEFNKKNEFNSYSFKKGEYDKGKFCFTIYYRLFYSTDLATLMRFCLDNYLIFTSGSSSSTCAYIDIM